eukprot:110578_1
MPESDSSCSFDIEAIKSSWEKIPTMDTMTDCMIDVFIDEFEDMLGFFADFDMEQVTVRMYDMFNDAVGMLPDLSPLRERLAFVASKHVKINLKQEHYDMGRTAIVGAVKQLEGDNWSDDLQKNWEQFYNKIASIIKEEEEKKK